MDAVKHFRHSRSFYLISFALAMAAAAWSRPALSPSPANVTLNTRTATSADIVITSTGAPITFAVSTTYASDGGNGQWLSFQQSSDTTPAALQLVLHLAGMGPGTYTATLNLTPTAPDDAVASSVTVTLNVGGGSGGTGTTISSSLSTVPLSWTNGNTAYASPSPVITTTSSTPIGLTLGTPTTSSGGNWLSAQLTTNSITSLVGATLLIQASPSGLSPGTYQGSISITPSTGTQISVGVTFTVASGGGGGGQLSVSPATINWNFNTSGGATPTQPLTLTSSGGSTTFSATVSSQNNWLLLNTQTDLTGTIGTALTAHVGSQAFSLSTGSYEGTITFTDDHYNQATVTVRLSVNGGATGLTVSPTSLSIPVSLNGSSQSQTVSVYSTSGGNFSASTNAAWLFASTNTGTLNPSSTGSVTVTANPGSYPNGTYSGKVTITVGGQSQEVPVTMVVGTGSGGGSTQSAVSPNKISVNWQAGRNPGLLPRFPINITGTSGNWSSNITYGTGASGWLTLSNSLGSSLPDQAMLVVDAPSITTAGTYTGTVAITTPSGTQNIDVTLVITTDSPVLISNPGGLLFTSPDGSTPTPQSVYFLSSDSSQFDLSGAVTTNATWISVAPIQPGQKTLSVSVDPAGLSSQTLSGSITVAVAGFPTMKIPVVLMAGNGSGGGGGSTGLLTFNPSPVNFTATVGTNPSQQVITVSANPQVAFTVSPSTTNGGNWLSVSTTSGTATTNISASVNVSGLAAGTYNGYLNFNVNGSVQSLPVTLTLSAPGSGNNGNVSVTPAPSVGFKFTAQVGSSNPNVQALQVTSASGSNVVNFTVQALTDNGGNWLSTSVNPGVVMSTPVESLTVFVNISGLAGGTYTGKIRVSPNGGTVVDVPVTLTVTAPPSVSATPAEMTFNYRAGGDAPAAQQIAVSGNGGTLSFTATASSTGNWLKVSPGTGTTPANVAVTVDGTGLSAGTYTGTVTVAGANGAPGTSTTTVTLKVTTPLPTISQVSNAASYSTASLAPGEIVTLFGKDLGPATPALLKDTPGGKVPTTLGGVQVLVNGIPAPIIYASSTQISAVIPYELAPFTSATVLVRYLGQSSNGVLMNVSTTAPGVFTQDASGTGLGAILNQNSTTNSASNPAARGETVVIYMTGEGQTSPAGVTGKVTTVNPAPPLTPAPVALVGVLIGGQPAQIAFQGEAPDMVSGVMQLNVVVPTTIAAGLQPVVVTVGPNSSQTGVTIALK